MSFPDPEEEAFVEGFMDASTRELMAMSDAELAVWQAGWRPGTERHILAEKEWARRLSGRQLREQFKLEERLAQRNRWWSVGAAALGVLGTVVGTFLGAHLTSSSPPETTSASASSEPSASAVSAPAAAAAASTSKPSSQSSHPVALPVPSSR